MHLRDLLRELVVRDMKLRYERSILGIAWSLLTPLAQLIVLSFVFTAVVPLPVPDYRAFLFIGLLAWTWFQTSLLEASAAVTANRDLVRRPGFPTGVLPAVPLLTHLIHFVMALPLLLIFVTLVMHVRFSLLGAPLLMLPIVIALQFALTLGCANLAATLQVYFRDTRHVMVVALMLLFYLTPVFYDTSLIPERYQSLYALNPLVHLLDAYRAILLAGRLPDVRSLLAVAGASTLLLAASRAVFRRFHDRFVEEL